MTRYSFLLFLLIAPSIALSGGDDGLGYPSGVSDGTNAVGGLPTGASEKEMYNQLNQVGNGSGSSTMPLGDGLSDPDHAASRNELNRLRYNSELEQAKIDYLTRLQQRQLLENIAVDKSSLLSVLSVDKSYRGMYFIGVNGRPGDLSADFYYQERHYRKRVGEYIDYPSVLVKKITTDTAYLQVGDELVGIGLSSRDTIGAHEQAADAESDGDATTSDTVTGIGG